MTIDSTPLIGQSVVSIENKDHSWFVTLSGGDSIATESTWRLVAKERIVVTSEDHGHQFGLPVPVDAAKRVTDTLKSDPITHASHDSSTGDLLLGFSSGRYLEFLQLSCGYESWRLSRQGKDYICMGGGEYTCFGQDNGS